MLYVDFMHTLITEERKSLLNQLCIFDIFKESIKEYLMLDIENKIEHKSNIHDVEILPNIIKYLFLK